MGVRIPVLIDVAELYRQAEVHRGRGNGLAVFIAKKLCPIHRGEMRLAIVEIEHVLLSQLDDLPIFDSKAPGVAARDNGLSIDHPEGDAASFAQDRLDSKVTDIQVQISISVHICQGQGSGPASRNQSNTLSRISKPTVA